MFEIDDAPTDAEAEGIDRALGDFNRERTGLGGSEPLRLVARDDDGRVRGGLLASTCYGWLYVSILHVDEEVRGGGLGTALMRRAEEIAVERGCHSVCLTTFSFQAKEFYERAGYRVYAELERYPNEHVLYFFRKEL